MQPGDLIARLQQPDAAIRLDALRILAMLEETEALEAVARVYQHDPDPKVRQAAGWAGKILYQARQRGHSTAQAIAALETTEPSEDAEDLVLAGMMLSLGRAGKAVQAQLTQEQLRLQHELLDTLQDNTDQTVRTSLTDLAADILDESGASDPGQVEED